MKAKIKSVKKISQQDVYDIEVPETHNFILSNGVIAHNCSHATSYAIIAYNGCWLKYHYPLDFWKGELTVHGNDEKKMYSYLRECGRFLDKIDIIKSDISEWVIEDSQKLRPPLSFIKGCGAKGAKSIKEFILKANTKIEIDSEELKENEEDEECQNDLG